MSEVTVEVLPKRCGALMVRDFALQQLSKRGIVACHGGRVSSLVAWGCVKVKVGSSILLDTGNYVFRTHLDMWGDFPDVVMLISKDTLEVRLLDASDPVFYKADGACKTAVTYMVNAHWRKSAPNLFDAAKWKLALYRWSLIEKHRLRYGARLREVTHD